MLYTQDQPRAFRVKRNRRCFNGHRFVTYEMHSKIASSVSKQRYASFLSAANERLLRYQRDLQLLLQREAGKAFEEMSAHFSMPINTIKSAVARLKRQRKEPSSGSR